MTIAVEALLRWRHPQRGVLTPEQFMAVAEECGLMVPIGDWVLRTACRQARAWSKRGFPVAVAVNLSRAQFVHPSLLASVDAALAESGLAPAFLALEITEALLMQHDGATATVLQSLHARGVQLTIDDFGTGYSSLNSLRELSLSKLKIAPAFVHDITARPEAAALVPAIIALARSLHLRVIAEGVEAGAQLDYLRLHGCDDYQGNYASSASANPDLGVRPH